jgi:hypothetical protein
MKIRLLGALSMVVASLACAGEQGHWEGREIEKVFDANGHVIGDLKSFGGVSGVQVIAGNAATIVQISRASDSTGHESATDFAWDTAASTEFTSTDCSGDPIVVSTGGPRPSVAVRQGNDVTVYIATDSAVQSFTARSMLVAGPVIRCVANPAPITVTGFSPGAKSPSAACIRMPLRIGF